MPINADAGVYNPIAICAYTDKHVKKYIRLAILVYKHSGIQRDISK